MDSQVLTKEEVKSILYGIKEEESEQGPIEVPYFKFFLFTVLFLAQCLALGWLALTLIELFFGQASLRVNTTINWQWLLSNQVSYLLVGSYGEWWLHLNVLHKQFPLLGKSFEAHHKVHHPLTILRIEREGIKSELPIDSKNKIESATFPWYIPVVIIPIIGVFAFIAQIGFPTLPIVMPAITATALAIGLYEVKHAIDHFPEAWWRKQCRRPKIGKLLLRLHSMHHLHHFSPVKNLNVVGFWGIPVMDMIAGTLALSPEFDNAWLNENFNPSEEVIEKIREPFKKIPWSFKIKKSLKKAFA